MDSILTLAKTEGMLFKFGSGTGTNFSTIRSSREALQGGGGATVLAIAMNDLGQVRAAITQIGAALLAEPAAAAVLAQLDGELDEVRRVVASRGARAPRKVLFVVDRQLGGLRGLVVAGPGTYLDELVRLAAPRGCRRRARGWSRC